MANYRLDPKIPEEAIYLDFDFSSLVASGVTINSATVTNARYSGTVDASPSSMLSGVPVVTGNVVSQLVIGGTAGTIYLVTVRGSGSDGTINDIQVLLPVQTVRLG